MDITGDRIYALFRCFGGIAKCSTSECWSTCADAATPTQYELQSAKAEQSASHKIILVCEASRAGILAEALKENLGYGSTPFSQRIAGIIFLDGIDQHHKCSELSKTEPGATRFRSDADLSGSTNPGNEFRTALFELRSIEKFIIRVKDTCRERVGNIPKTKIFDCAWGEHVACTTYAILRLGDRMGALLLSPGSPLSDSKLKVCESHCEDILADAIQAKNRRDTVLLLKAVLWVATAFRHLLPSELIHAIQIQTHLDQANGLDTQNYVSITTETLMSLCKGVIGLRVGGYLDFEHANMRAFVQASETSLFDKYSIGSGHEYLATACLSLLRETAQDIIRPWKAIMHDFLCGGISSGSDEMSGSNEVNLSGGDELSDHHSTFFLRRYASTFWHYHYRIAESSSPVLPALLHQVVDTAARAESIRLPFEDRIRTVDLGLKICTANDLPVAGKAYIQMGARFNFRSCSEDEYSVANLVTASPQMLRLLLPTNLSQCKEIASFPRILCAAASAGSVGVVEILLEKHVDPNCHYDSHTHIDLIPGLSPLYYAAAAGHLDVCRLLLNAGAFVNWGGPSAGKPDSHEHAVPNCKWDEALTPLDLALQGAHTQVASLLLEWGGRGKTAMASSTSLRTSNGEEMLERESARLQHLSLAGKSEDDSRHPLVDAAEAGKTSSADAEIPFNIDRQDEEGWLLVDYTHPP